MAKKPKLALIPSGYKVNKVYSVLPSDGVGDFNFSRSGSATRINKDGLIETVASNVPRLNYPLIDGKVVGCPSHLLEPQRTNLIQYSEDFTNAYWTKSNVSLTSGFISPDGTANAFKLVEDSATSTHELEVTGIAVVANKYSMSLFVKAGERNKIQIKLRNYFAGDPSVIFDLENGTFQQNAQAIGSMTLLSNGFYKCTFTTVLNAIAGGNAILNVNLVDDANQTSYTGNGTSGVYIYGAQLEQGIYATSYIPTSGSATTRSAETCNNSGDANTFNDSEGVLMVETKGENDGTFNYISISDGGTQNYAGILYTDEDNQITYRYYVGGSGVQIVINDIIATNFNKIAIKYKANDFAIWINGIEVGTASSGSLNPSGTFNELAFARGGSNNTPFYGNVKQIQYFDSALNDSDLEELTSWDSFSDMAISQLYTIE